MRAVAVLAVVAFHFDKNLLRGGFLGVDIFFVISGFLITGIIQRELDANDFSFMRFYARRVKRIYPALLAMIAASLVAAAMLMLPTDYAALGKSAQFAAAGLSNFYFWFSSGYFSAEAKTLPLLHTWSLGVEEQFYSVWPFVLVFLYKLKAKSFSVPIAASAAFVVSLIFYVLVYSQDDQAQFYSPVARAFELAMGAAVAVVPPIRNRAMAESAGLTGIVICGAALFYCQGSQNIASLISVSSGSALLIWPKQFLTIAARTLSIRPLAFVGSLSYSIYIWHWPIYVLMSQYLFIGGRLPAEFSIYYFCITTIISLISFYLVERPIRQGATGHAVTVVIGVAVAALFITLSNWIAVDGLVGRFDPASLRYLSTSLIANDRHQPSGAQCFIGSGDAARGIEYTADQCLTISTAKRNVLVVGDSHAYQFIGPLVETYPELNFSLAAASHCFSLLDDTGDRYCTDLARRIYTDFLVSKRFDGLIIVNRWRDVHILNQLVPTVDLARSLGVTPYVIGPNNETSAPLPSLLTYELLRHTEIAKYYEADKPVLRADARLEKILSDRPGVYFSIYKMLCSPHCAKTTPEDQPMLSDENHLSGPAARLVIRKLRAEGFLKDILPSPQE